MNGKDKRIFIVALLVISFICTALLILHNTEYDNEHINYININTATERELTELPGIGEVLAKRIIEGRPYETMEQLLDIYGIGEKRYKIIKDRSVIK